jgi:hypothetical protein
MTLEVRRMSGVSEDAFGSLSSCLIEGDPQSEKRARRIKQRALAISIVLQTLALVALVLFPLLSKGERISLMYATPIPPYARIGNHHQPHPTQVNTRLRPATSVPRQACPQPFPCVLRILTPKPAAPKAIRFPDFRRRRASTADILHRTHALWHLPK